MGLSIKNAEVETMIRTLAEKRGVSMTEALRQALEAELAREDAAREAEVARKLAALLEIAENYRKLPTLDHRTADEILGYDENGLPT